jgi:O-antigen/teichoic acid export membrane protein
MIKLKTLGFFSKVLYNDNVSKGILTVLDQIVVSGTNFIITIIIGRACIKDELGLYVLGFTIVVLALDLQYVLIISPYTVTIPEFFGEEHSSYTGSTLVHHLCLSILVIIIIGVTSAIMFWLHKSRDLTLVLIILSATIWPIMIKEYVRLIFIANLQIRKAFFFDLSVAFFQIFGIITLAFFGLLSARITYIIIGCSSGLISYLAWYIWIRKAIFIIGKEIRKDFSRNWSFSKWMLLSTILFTINVQLYPWIINYFFGPGDTGIFSACKNLIYLTNPLLIGMGVYLVPLSSHNFIKRGVNGLRKIVLYSTILLSIIIGIFCIIVLKYGGLLVQILYGAQFAGNGRLVGIFAIGIFVWSLSLPANYGLLAMKKPDADSKGYLIVLGFNITIGILLVRHLGIYGAAYSLLLINLIMLVCRCSFYYYWYHNFKSNKTIIRPILEG